MSKLKRLNQCSLFYRNFIGVFLVLIFLVGCGPTKPILDINGDKIKSRDSKLNYFVVISMGKGLDNNAKDIQKAFFKKLKPYLNTRLPFTLLTFQPGTVENLFSNWNDITSKKELWKKIHSIRFGFSLDALQGLKLVEDKHHGSFTRILYLTDNGNMDDIESSALTVPKNWKSGDIEFFVLTSSSCQPWNEKAYATQCTTLRGRNDIENVLRNFIGK